MQQTQPPQSQSGMSSLEHLLHQAQMRAAKKASKQAFVFKSEEDTKFDNQHDSKLDNVTASPNLSSASVDADKNIDWILNRSLQLNNQNSSNSNVTANNQQQIPLTSSSSTWHDILNDSEKVSNNFTSTSIANARPISNSCDAAAAATTRTKEQVSLYLESSAPNATSNVQEEMMNVKHSNNNNSDHEYPPVEKDKMKTKLDMDAAVALAIQRLEKQKERDQKLEDELKQEAHVGMVLLDVEKENHVLKPSPKEEAYVQRSIEVSKSTKRQQANTLPTSEVKLTKYNSSSDVIKKFKEKWANDREELQRGDSSFNSCQKKLGTSSSKEFPSLDQSESSYQNIDSAYSTKFNTKHGNDFIEPTTDDNHNEHWKIKEMEQRLSFMEEQLLTLHNENNDLAHKLQDAAETISNAVLLTSSKSIPNRVVANEENESLRRHVQNLEKEIEMLKRNILIQNRSNVLTSTNQATMSINRTEREKMTAMNEHSLVMQQAAQALNHASSMDEPTNQTEPRELTPMWFNNVSKSYNIRGHLTSESELANKSQVNGSLFKERNGRAKIIGLPESPEPPSSLVTSPHYSQSEDDDEFLIVMTPRSAEKKAHERAQQRLKELTEKPVVVAPRQRSADDERISQRIQQLFSKFPIKRARDGDPDLRRKSPNENHQQQQHKDAEVKNSASKPWSAKEALAADNKAYESGTKKSKDLEDNNPTTPVPPWILKKRQLASGMGQRSVSTSDLSNTRQSDKPVERKNTEHFSGNEVNGVARTAISKSLSNQLKNFLNSASPRPQPKVNVYTLGRRIFDSHESTKHGTPVKAIHLDLSKSQNFEHRHLDKPQHQSNPTVDNCYPQTRQTQLTRSYEDPTFEMRRAASLRDNSKRVQFSDSQHRLSMESTDEAFQKSDPPDTTWSDADEMELRERVRGLLHRQRGLGNDVIHQRHSETKNTQSSSFARTVPASNDSILPHRSHLFEQTNKKKIMSPVPPLNLDAFHLDLQETPIGGGGTNAGGASGHQRDFDASLGYAAEQENFRSRKVAEDYVKKNADMIITAHQYSNDLLKKYAHRH